MAIIPWKNYVTPRYRDYAAGGMMLGAAAAGYGSGYGVRTRRGSAFLVRNKRRRRYGRSFSLKKKIYNTLPAKHCPYTDITATILHNGIYTFGPSQTIARGTANDQRIGDSVHMEALKLNGYVKSNASLNAGVQFRIIVLWSGEEYASATALTSGLGNSEVFLTNAGTWTASGLTNPKAVTVLDDRIINLNNTITNAADLESFAYTVPIHQDFDYQAAGSVMGKSRNLYVVVVASIDGGTTGVTTAGTCLIYGDLIFK